MGIIIQSSRLQRAGAASVSAGVPTAVPSASSIPTPTSSPKIVIQNLTGGVAGSNDNSLVQWRYPNSTSVAAGLSSLTLDSQDDPTVVTNWYKDKIKNSGMSVKTFVTTNTNGSILNKLAGAEAGKNMSIEISRGEGQSAVRIVVAVD